MSANLKHKYKFIHDRERSLANSMARSVIKPKPIGVWEFMIPFIFILIFMKNKQIKELLVQNFMFTKKLALDASFEMIQTGCNKEEEIAKIEKKTSDILASDTQKIYSDEIRRKQIKEIDLLIDHYLKLLETEGEDYSSLVINAYQSHQSYMTFLEQLKSAEKEVSKAAQETLGDRADTATLTKIEKTTDRIRVAEIEKIFKTKDGRQDAQ